MVQPQKWGLGLFPLAVLLLVGGFWRQGGVEQDLAQRSTARLAGAGHSWATVSLSGRDAILQGEAPSPEARAEARASAEATFGLRQAKDRMTVLPEAKPFTFTAMRDGNRLTLTGFVPPGNAREALLAAARTSHPGLAITDEMKLARGAAAGFGALAGFGLGELARLSGGTLSISDAALSISGRAADFARYAELRRNLAALPAGGRLGKGLGPGEILPPLVKPFGFSAERGPGGLVLAGVVPSEAALARVLAEARALGIPVRESLQIADGAPGGDWAGAAAALVRELGKLEAGRAMLTDERAALTGRARDSFTEEDLRAGLRTLPSGYSLAQLAIESRVVRPFTFGATRLPDGVRLSGYVPDARAKADILEAARRYFEGEKVEDRLVEALGAPADFLNAVRAGLHALARLAPGAEFALSGENAGMNGAALFEFARGDIAAEFARMLPASFKGAPQLGIAPLPPPVTAPNECQLLYDAALRRGTVRFRSGSAELSDESRAIVDRLTVTSLRCVNARIEIGGHTDSDGNPASNAELSRRRSETVAAYMARAGVPVDRLEPVGYGQTVPVAPNDTPENKARNRRIEFIVK